MQHPDTGRCALFLFARRNAAAHQKRRSARCRRQKHRGRSAEFFARFLATLYRNLPWALLWQIFAAGPATRGVFRAIFHKQLVENDRKAFSSDTECDKMGT